VTAVARHAVRFREEFEMRCEKCGEWWPLTLEFWDPLHGVNRCTACLRDAGQHPARIVKERLVQPVEEAKERARLLSCVAQKRYYHRHHDEVLARRRDYYQRNRDAVKEAQRLYRQRRAA
jgi:hypothetical protein